MNQSSKTMSMERIETIKAKLQEISELEDDWDDVGSKAVPSELADKLLDCLIKNFPASLSVPFVAPTSKGGIGLDWNINSDKIVSLEVNGDHLKQGKCFNSVPLSIINISPGAKSSKDSVDFHSEEDWSRIGKIISKLSSSK